MILPILEEYFYWVNTLNPEKVSKLTEAVTCTRNQRTALNAFLDHGNVPISNNLAENAIRSFAAGRKNRLPSASIIRDRQDKYDHAINCPNCEAESASFIRLMLSAIREVLFGASQVTKAAGRMTTDSLRRNKVERFIA